MDDLENPVQLKPVRHAPPVPAKKQEQTENQEISTKAVEESVKSKPVRRPPPPKPTPWGVEVPPTDNSFTPQAVQAEPPVKPVPLARSVPPPKPKEDHQPQQQQQQQPSPAKKKPVPPEKPQSRMPPVPPSKPVSSTAPITKPKPLVLPKPTGITNGGDGPPSAGYHSTPEVAPKPKLKPRVPAKPTNVGSGGGEEVMEEASVPVPVAKFGEHVASLHSDSNTGFSLQYDVSRDGQSEGGGWGVAGGREE